jgi:hypothetical protein
LASRFSIFSWRSISQSIAGVKLVLMGIGNAKLLRQRFIGPGMRHGELARFRRDNAARNHRRHEIALARPPAIDQLIEAEPPHREPASAGIPGCRLPRGASPSPLSTSRMASA